MICGFKVFTKLHTSFS